MTLLPQNLFLCLCSFFCGLVSSTNSRRPVVTSFVRMCKLAQFEQDLLSFVREGPLQLPPQFVNFVSSIEEEYRRVYDSSLSFIDFPINQYRLIRRFSYDWPLWREQLRLMEHVDHTAKVSSTLASEFLTFYKQQSKKHNEIDNFDPNFDLPTACKTITRLYILYRNKSGLLINEEPIGWPRLSEIELLDLCETARKHATRSNDMMYHAFHWLTIFVERMKKHLPYSSVMFMIEYVLKHRNTYGRPDHYHRTLPVEERMKRLGQVIRQMEGSPHHLKKFLHNIDKSLETEVCRSVEDRSEHGNYCFLFHTPSAPYAPFKYEILHSDPYVAVVHNFMPLRKAQSYISTAIKKGSFINKITDGYSRNASIISSVRAEIRLSEGTTLHNSHPLIVWLDLRIEQATLLQPNSQPIRFGVRDAEKVQIQHYGLSGHYRSHFDFFPMDPFGMKGTNRLATVVVYLNDVHSGGCTAFPRLNVSLTPRGGSALVWFNLDPSNGTRLFDTLHVGCPVRVGKKWIINRWIRSHFNIGHSKPVVHQFEK